MLADYLLMSADESMFAPEGTLWTADLRNVILVLFDSSTFSVI